MPHPTRLPSSRDSKSHRVQHLLVHLCNHPANMTELLDLCYDVLIRILEEIDPPDLAACAQTSVGFNEFIRKNTRLYKAQYLKSFVRPSKVLVEAQILT